MRKAYPPADDLHGKIQHAISVRLICVAFLVCDEGAGKREGSHGVEDNSWCIGQFPKGTPEAIACYLKTPLRCRLAIVATIGHQTLT